MADANLTFRLGGGLARMLGQRDKEEARQMLHDTMQLGCVGLQTSLEYKIIDALYERGQVGLGEKVIFLHIRASPTAPHPEASDSRPEGQRVDGRTPDGRSEEEEGTR